MSAGTARSGFRLAPGEQAAAEARSAEALGLGLITTGESVVLVELGQVAIGLAAPSIASAANVAHVYLDELGLEAGEVGAIPETGSELERVHGNAWRRSDRGSGIRVGLQRLFAPRGSEPRVGEARLIVTRNPGRWLPALVPSAEAASWIVLSRGRLQEVELIDWRDRARAPAAGLTPLGEALAIRQLGLVEAVRELAAAA